MLILFGLLFIYLQPAIIAVPVTSYATIITLLPGLIPVCLSVFFIVKSRRLARVGSWLGLGMGSAYLFSLLNAEGLLIGLFAGLLLADIQIWCIVLTVLASAIGYAHDVGRV